MENSPLGVLTCFFFEFLTVSARVLAGAFLEDDLVRRREPSSLSVSAGCSKFLRPRLGGMICWRGGVIMGYWERTRLREYL